MLEVNLAIIAASLPMLDPLWSNMVNKFRSNTGITARKKFGLRLRELRTPSTTEVTSEHIPVETYEPLEITVHYTFAVERASVSDSSLRNSFAEGEMWSDSGRPSSVAKSSSRYGATNRHSAGQGTINGPDNFEINLGPFMTDESSYKDKD